MTAAPTHLETLLTYIKDRHPRSQQGLAEARAGSPARFDSMASMFLEWLTLVLGEQGIASATDSFVLCPRPSTWHRHATKLTGITPINHLPKFMRITTAAQEAMGDYLWGSYLTNFLWAHHTEISYFFEDRFLSRLPQDAQLVEIAPGHGGWGTWALSVLKGATLRGYDISPSSIEIARSLSKAAGFDDRATYEERMRWTWRVSQSNRPMPSSATSWSSTSNSPANSSPSSTTCFDLAARRS